MPPAVFVEAAAAEGDPVAGHLRVHSSNNVLKEVHTLVILEVPGSVEAVFGDFGPFCSILDNVSAGTLPKITSTVQVPRLVRHIIQGAHSYMKDCMNLSLFTLL